MAANTANYGEEKNSDQPVPGKKTLEYKRVLTNLLTIVDSLNAHEAAKDSLCREFKQKQWIDVNKDDPPPDDLMKVLLHRIELDVGTYDEFMAMLDSITGMDLVMKEIKETTCKWYVCYSRNHQSFPFSYDVPMSLHSHYCMACAPITFLLPILATMFASFFYTCSSPGRDPQ